MNKDSRQVCRSLPLTDSFNTRGNTEIKKWSLEECN